MKKIIILLLLCKVSTLSSTAQDTIKVSQLSSQFFISPSKTDTVRSVLETPKLLDFVLSLQAQTEFCICNDEKSTKTLFFLVGNPRIFLHSSSDIARDNAGMNAFMKLHITSQAKHISSQQNGFLVPYSERAIKDDMQSFYFSLQASVCHTFQFDFFDLQHRPPSTQVQIMTSEVYWKYRRTYRRRTALSNFISIAFLGGMGIMFFFTVAIFLQNRLPEFGYYALYLISVLIFEVIAEYPFRFYECFMWELPQYWLYSKEILAFSYLMAYHFFVIRFLDLARTRPFLYKILRLLNVIYTVMIFVSIFVLYGTSLDTQHHLFVFNSRLFYITFPIYAYLIGALWFLSEIPFSRYIFVGSLFFYLGNVLSALSEVFGLQAIYLYPNNLMQLGTLSEILFFSFALGKKLLLDSEDKNRLQKEIIIQLEEKEKFISEINAKLAQDVQEKTEEIIAQDRNLQAEREEKIRMQFQQQLGEMQLYALQTQLNPHFLFNCLNTIKALILNQKNEQASRYLSQFAMLMRNTLENSRQLSINLKQSIEYLKTYIQIEELRFTADFDYEVSYEGEEDPALLDVPPMLIQPFVENAIIHGLIPLKRPKKLKVYFQETEEYLLCQIEDNGVGFSEHTDSAHISRGMEMIQKYFDLWNKHQQSNASFEIIDKAQQNPKEQGVLVLIKLPFQ